MSFQVVRWLLCCGVFALPGSSSVRAEEGVSVEYKIKAAYLLNFAKFVEWPKDRFSTGTAPIKVGVLGKDPFGADLERTMAGRVIEGRKFTIVRTDDVETAASCHIVFVSSSERRRHPQLLERLRTAAALTVGETDQFTDEGGMIRFLLRDNTVRFQINAPAAEKAGLRISSRLLQIARPENKGD